MTTFEHIKLVVCKGEIIMPELLNLTSNRRDRELVFARQCIFYLMKKLTKESLAQIGKYYRKDHATVIHAVRTINNLIDTDKSIAVKIAGYEELIRLSIEFNYITNIDTIRKVKKHIQDCITNDVEIPENIICIYNDLLKQNDDKTKTIIGDQLGEPAGMQTRDSIPVPGNH